jgi:hypothetical protein
MPTDDQARIEQLHARFRAYRETGWALSTSTIAFATALLAWSLPRTAGPAMGLFYFQAGAALLTIVAAFFQQLSYYRGAQFHARADLDALLGRHPVQNINDSNWWFSRADNGVVAATLLLLAAMILSVALWFQRSV